MIHAHHIHPSLLSDTVPVALVGCGGSGSQMLTGLARLHTAMVALGHPGGLEVTVYDPDAVSASNVGRQLFSHSDVGLNKAIVLTHRVNSFFGLNWLAEPRSYTAGDGRDALVISCVDSRAARKEIAREQTMRYWLDMGNRQHDGQVVLGEGEHHYQHRWTRDAYRLPLVSELFPEIIDDTQDGDNDGPSCSLAEALERQSLFINQAVVTFALDLLFQLFRNGRLVHHGAFINLAAGLVQPLAIDPALWKRINPALKSSVRSRARLNGKSVRKADIVALAA
jgi:PRTRC genetic system ThiF family protein